MLEDVFFPSVHPGSQFGGCCKRSVRDRLRLKTKSIRDRTYELWRLLQAGVQVVQVSHRLLFLEERLLDAFL